MRKIPKLTNPNRIERQTVIQDFSKFTKNSKGLIPTKKGVKGGEIITSVASFSNISALKFYCVRDNYYAYLQNGNVVKYVGGEWILICSSSVTPYIIAFKNEGRDCTLVVGDQAFIVYDDNQVVPTVMPYGSSAVIYKEMLFVANGNRLNFSKLLDYKNFSSGLNNSGFVTTEKVYGDIIALIPTESTLIIICKRAIYNLYPVGERQAYTLVKQDVALKAKENSAQSAGNLTYVFSEKTLCKYQGGVLSKVNCSLNDKYSFDGQSGVDGNTYYATLVDDLGDRYLFTFNQVTGNECLIKTQSILLANGGLFIEDDSVKRFSSEIQPSDDAEWESVELDFNSPLLKNLVGVAVKTNTDLTLELESSYDKQELRFASGFNLERLNLTDKAFKVKLKLNSLGASVEKIKFIYRLQEE